MRFAVSFVLLLFVTFLSTPSIVGLIEKGCDTSIFYSMTEEELSHKVVKAEMKFELAYEVIDLSGFTSSLILSENLSKHDNVAATIFIPPPEHV